MRSAHTRATCAKPVGTQSASVLACVLKVGSTLEIPYPIIRQKDLPAQGQSIVFPSSLLRVRLPYQNGRVLLVLFLLLLLSRISYKEFTITVSKRKKC